MPLVKKGKDCVAKNMKTLLKEKRPQRQAIAIALKLCGKKRQRHK